jgi:hypothetical protein
VLTLRSLAKVTHHVRLDIGGEYFAVGNALGDPYTEISGTCADVGDIRSAFEMQSVQNLFRLLPSFAFWAVELFGPFIRISESTMEGPIGWTTRMMARMAVQILVLHSERRLRERVAHSHAALHDYENGDNRQYLVFHFAPTVVRAKRLAAGSIVTARNEMSAHKFRIGQIVTYRPDQRGQDVPPGGAYTVTARLPDSAVTAMPISGKC